MKVWQIQAKYITKATITAAFKHLGIWPINRDIFTKEGFTPSLNFSTELSMPSTFPKMITSSPFSAKMTDRRPTDISSDNDSSDSDDSSFMDVLSPTRWYRNLPFNQ
ncbi:hypothetical protein M422DRAFT_275668 [Sphaerobolus stellatus SS14]|uniref:Uncharacterized protein n=1 Tax=Sphaerobolus stellatus (strain SS14) TaxID=990650 RepID=A0A0C9U3J8_SPHS4|nr:hypothetical protein M422DRAFT_275668 [Sphaerobolus stellatus SS14]